MEPALLQPNLFDAFFEACLELGVCHDVASWAALFDVLPPNARRYVAGTLRPRPERVQIWCDRLREAHGHLITIELPPNVNEAILAVERADGARVTHRCRFRQTETADASPQE